MVCLNDEPFGWNSITFSMLTWAGYMSEVII